MGLGLVGGILFSLVINLAVSSSNFTQEVFIHEKCLNLPEVIPKRYLSHNGTNQVIKLGVSDRLSHKLATNVFYIFLKEVLGYPNVSLIQYSSKFDIDQIFSVFYEGNKQSGWAPEYMINLEVWIHPVINTIHITETHSVKECGSIAPPGRFSWFIPSSMMSSLNGYPMDHWKLFTFPNITGRFSLSHSMSLVDKYRSAEDQEYIPDQCAGWKTQCAALLVEKSSVPNENWLKADIIKLKLYVRIIWIKENHLEPLVVDLTKELRGSNWLLVFLGYTPSLISLEEELVPVNFPPCDLFSSKVFCSYAHHRLVKLAWSKLSGSAKPAFDSLQKMEFTAEDYKEMILSYQFQNPNKEEGIEDDLVYKVACDWMKNHSKVGHAADTHWDSWTPKDEERNELNIGGIFPLGPRLFNAEGTVMAAKYAIDAVNRNPMVLRDYKLNFLLDDGQCKKDIVMKTFIEYILQNNYKKLVGILGPACSDTVEPLAGITRHFGTVVISYSAEGSSFSNRDKYPYFFRTIAENKQYQYVYLALFKALGWKRVASITEDGTKYPEYISHTQALLRANDISFVDNRKYPPDWTRETMRKAAEEIKKNDARIVIADVDIEAARVLMCDAYHLRMTAKEGYVWFLPYWLHPNWYNSTEVSAPNRASECNTSQLIEAANGHFSLAHMFFAPDDTMMQEGISVGEWKRENNVHSDYAGYAYDAIWTFAFALDQLIKENESYLSDLHSNASTTRFVELIKKTNFTGVSGHIYFGEGGSRTSPVNLIQLINGRKNIVGTFYPNTSDKLHGGRMEMGSPLWLNPGGAVPWDGTPPAQRCAIEALANFLQVDCHVAFIIANITGFLLLICILFIAFLFIKDRYDKKVKLTQKYMKSLGIDLNATSVGSLDKWEIPRDRVVINRKLGEGAFGMVYGGEALFNEKGWVAVAVKTLKVGSSTSEKLDFLSEAEVMKRFEHKNIVKLLGVCTQNEPVYTIMEFMLYGDLKTYLLARRDLVNERMAEESDEISSKKLTSMALDVARALSYLAELKYVHRDVASRNCLVNASRVVKLGDFGMTRPMFESDYYKFTRKGMLPVRWMAPESLALGVFTPASDVWSYGVLLYEIITFGSFPFQGMSNNQVLEHVKAGNTLSIPAGIKPQLASLIQTCWERESKSRMTASAIVELLADNPRLLSPCLDAPLSSVQLEDTGQLEMQMSDKSRKFSLSLRQRIPSSPTQLINSGLTTPTESRSLWSEPTNAGEPLLPSPNHHFPRNNSEEDYSISQTDSIL